MQVIERRLNRRRSERAAADAEHDERIEFLADLRGGRFDVGDDFLLIVGQIHPALHVLATAGLHRRVRALQLGDERVQIGAGNAARADVFRHHRIDVQAN